MKRKKWISLLLAATLSLSLLSGCGDKKEAETEPANEAPAAETDDSTEPDAPEEPEAAEEAAAPEANDSPSWKEDTSDCTITWFMAYDWYGKKFDEANNLFDKKLYEETGVKIDIQTGDTDKLNMLIQTGKLPDIITLDANSTQRKLLEDNGMVQPLKPLMDQYAPDLLVPQSMIDWYTAKDGNWYSIASYYYGDDNIADNQGYYETHNQNYVREDILSQIGMSIDDLQTKEGFLDALRAVKDQNIQYNGQTVVPYMVLFSDIAEIGRAHV